MTSPSIAARPVFTAVTLEYPCFLAVTAVKLAVSTARRCAATMMTNAAAIACYQPQQRTRKRRVNFFSFFALFCKTGFVDRRRGFLSSTNLHHRPALSGSMLPPGPRAPFCRAPPLLALAGAAWHAREEPPGYAAAASPANESQGAGIRPGDRSGAAAAPQWSLPSAPPH